MLNQNDISEHFVIKLPHGLAKFNMALRLFVWGFMETAALSLLHASVITGLKAIGSIFRIGDIPQKEKHIRRVTAVRELIVLGLLFSVSAVLDYAAKKSSFMQQKPYLSYGIQAIAYFASEWLSRKLTHYKNRTADIYSPKLNVSDGQTNPFASTNTAFSSKTASFPSPKPMFATSFSRTPMLSLYYNSLQSSLRFP